MEITDSGARALLAAIIHCAFQDVRRLYRSGHVSKNIQVTQKALDDAYYSKFRKGELSKFNKRKKHHEGVHAANAFEITAFFRTQACKEMLEFFKIDADPVECAQRSIENRGCNNGYDT